MIARRSFLTGLGALIAAPAVVRAEHIMPVRAVIWTPPDPLVRGVRWQSWPFGQSAPEFYCTGSIGLEFRANPKPLSHFLKHVEAHRKWYPNLVWEAVSPPPRR